jgi:hypothetical protein
LEVRDIVERDDPGVTCRDDEVALVARLGANVGGVRIDEPSQRTRGCRLCGALLAVSDENRIGSAW